MPIVTLSSLNYHQNTWGCARHQAIACSARFMAKLILPTEGRLPKQSSALAKTVFIPSKSRKPERIPSASLRPFNSADIHDSLIQRLINQESCLNRRHYLYYKFPPLFYRWRRKCLLLFVTCLCSLWEPDQPSEEIFFMNYFSVVIRMHRRLNATLYMVDCGNATWFFFNYFYEGDHKARFHQQEILAHRATR